MYEAVSVWSYVAIQGAFGQHLLTIPSCMACTTPPCFFWSDEQTEIEAEKIASVNVFIVILAFHFGQDPGQELSHEDDMDTSHAGGEEFL